MPTSKTVKRVSGAGNKTGPTLFQRLASTRMVGVNGQSAIYAHRGEVQTGDKSGGSMEGWRKSRMRPKGSPTLSENRQIKR